MVSLCHSLEILRLEGVQVFRLHCLLTRAHLYILQIHIKTVMSHKLLSTHRHLEELSKYRSKLLTARCCQLRR